MRARSSFKASGEMGTLQRYHKSPLENVFPPRRELPVCACGELDYSTRMLAAIPFYAVAAGAIIEAADLKVTKTVIVGALWRRLLRTHR